MINTDLYLAFVLISAGVILLPGPNVLLTISNSINHGLGVGLMSVAGAVTAMIIQLTVASLGVSSLMLLLAQWFEWLRWLGVGYLVFLGIRQMLSAARPTAARPAPCLSPVQSYWQGFLVSLTNPKTIFFFAAFLPQFVSAAAPALPQLALLSATFVLMALVFDSTYALAAASFGRRLVTLTHNRIKDYVSGAILVGAGAFLALLDTEPKR